MYTKTHSKSTAAVPSSLILHPLFPPTPSAGKGFAPQSQNEAEQSEAKPAPEVLAVAPVPTIPIATREVAL